MTLEVWAAPTHQRTQLMTRTMTCKRTAMIPFRSNKLDTLNETHDSKLGTTNLSLTNEGLPKWKHTRRGEMV